MTTNTAPWAVDPTHRPWLHSTPGAAAEVVPDRKVAAALTTPPTSVWPELGDYNRDDDPFDAVDLADELDDDLYDEVETLSTRPMPAPRLAPRPMPRPAPHPCPAAGIASQLGARARALAAGPTQDR
jgi:hypothetical protein